MHTLAQAKQEGYVQFVSVNNGDSHDTIVNFDADGYGGADGLELATLQNVHDAQHYDQHFVL